MTSSAARQVVAVAVRVNPNFTVKGAGLTMGGKPRQFGIEIGVEQRPRRLHALLHLMRIDARDGKPLIAGPAGNAGRRIGRCESDGGKQGPPMLRQADQVLAVGAVAMHQHHQMRGGSAGRRNRGSVQCHDKGLLR